MTWPLTREAETLLKTSGGPFLLRLLGLLAEVLLLVVEGEHFLGLLDLCLVKLHVLHVRGGCRDMHVLVATAAHDSP